jgi:hypothetical protein
VTGHSPPWSAAELLELEDRIRDGWPAKAIGEKIGRSTFAVIRMAVKIGMRIQRARTKPVQVQFDANLYEQLRDLAFERNVSAPTLCRLILEISLRTPCFIDQLLDDGMEARNASPLSLSMERRPHALGAAAITSEPLWQLRRVVLEGCMGAPRLLAALH